MRKVKIWVFAMEDGWAKSPSEEMATLLISTSFAVNPDFSCSDGLEWQFSREARVGIMKRRKGGKPAGFWQIVSIK